MWYNEQAGEGRQAEKASRTFCPWLTQRNKDARVIWRSGGLETDFVNQVKIRLNGRTTELGELLAYDRSLANTLRQKDRVQTYGSFYIADIKAMY